MDDQRFQGILDQQQQQQQRAQQLKFLQQRRQSLPLIPNPNAQLLHHPQNHHQQHQQHQQQQEQQQPRLPPNVGQNLFGVGLQTGGLAGTTDFMMDPLGTNFTLGNFSNPNPFSPTFPMAMPGSRLGAIPENNDFERVAMDIVPMPLSRRHSVAMTDAPVLQTSPIGIPQAPTSQPVDAQDVLDLPPGDPQQSLASFGLDMTAPLEAQMSPLVSLAQTQPMIPASSDPIGTSLAASPGSGSGPNSAISQITGSAPGISTEPVSRTGSLTAPGSDTGVAADIVEPSAGKGALVVASSSSAPGPLPVSTNSGGGSSTLTEFTKRRNWSQRIIEEIQDFLHILTPNGKIRYAGPSSKMLTGYTPEELVGRMITDFVHSDDSHLFIREFNESIASGQPLRLYYRFKKADSNYVVLETTGHPHFADTPQLAAATSTPVCSGFFMMARQYPTKNAALLDSFLEHKIENERLTKRINELRKEEMEEQQAAAKARSRAGESQDGATADTASQPSITVRAQSTPNSTAENVAAPLPTSVSASKSMPPPAKPTSSSTALTRQNLDNLDASRDNEVLREKMARFDSNSHVETIEMLTGLRYREGERSRGISTGDTSPSLIRGDAGVPMPIDKDTRLSGERKKKQKVANEYVCTDCGTLESPEWRKGPTGPKTLCNACGLRWAKKEKKRNSVSHPSVMAPPPGAMAPPSIPPLKHFNSASNG